jgi:hypothetical protein
VVGLVRRGAWAELVAVPARSLALIPDRVSDVQAATLPTAGLTVGRRPAQIFLDENSFLLAESIARGFARTEITGRQESQSAACLVTETMCGYEREPGPQQAAVS